MMLHAPSPMMAADALGDVHDVMLSGPWWSTLYTWRWLYAARGAS